MLSTNQKNLLKNIIFAESLCYFSMLIPKTVPRIESRVPWTEGIHILNKCWFKLFALHVNGNKMNFANIFMTFKQFKQ